MGRFVAYNPQISGLWAKVRIPGITPATRNRDARVQEMREWCEEACVGRWTCSYEWDSTRRAYYDIWLFKDARDAMTFKLTWAGE